MPILYSKIWLFSALLILFVPITQLPKKSSISLNVSYFRYKKKLYQYFHLTYIKYFLFANQIVSKYSLRFSLSSLLDLSAVCYIIFYVSECKR